MTGERIDEMTFHVSSSLKKAESYIEMMMVQPYSWWAVAPFNLDSEDYFDEGDDEIYYYNHKGKKVKNAPIKQAIKAYRKSDNPLVVASKLAVSKK